MKTEELTLEQASEVFDLVLYKDAQEKIEGTDKAWMLDYVYDSKLLKSLENHWTNITTKE